MTVTAMLAELLVSTTTIIGAAVAVYWFAIAINGGS